MNKIFDNKQEFTELYRDAVMSISGKSVEAASDLDRFNACLLYTSPSPRD